MEYERSVIWVHSNAKRLDFKREIHYVLMHTFAHLLIKRYNDVGIIHPQQYEIIYFGEKARESQAEFI